MTEQQGKQDHLTAHEQSRQALEHSSDDRPPAAPTVGHGIAAFGHDDIAALAALDQCFRGKQGKVA